MILEDLVKDFHSVISAPVEQRYIDQADILYCYLRNLGVEEENIKIWDNHRRRLINTKTLLEETIGHIHVETILDIGANMIFMPIWREVTPNAKLVLGIDEGQAKILTNMGEVIFPYHGDFEFDPIPLDDNSVDVVGMFEVFEHFYVDPMFVISQVNRVLKPGGIFVVTAPNSTSWRSILAALTHYHPYQYPMFAGPGSRRHVHEPAPQDLHLALRSGGFDVNVFTLNNFSSAIPRSFYELCKGVGASPDLRGDTVVAIGKKSGPVIDRFPGGLYDRGSMAISGNLSRQ